MRGLLAHSAWAHNFLRALLYVLRGRVSLAVRVYGR